MLELLPTKSLGSSSSSKIEKASKPCSSAQVYSPHPHGNFSITTPATFCCPFCQGLLLEALKTFRFGNEYDILHTIKFVTGARKIVVESNFVTCPVYHENC